MRNTIVVAVTMLMVSLAVPAAAADTVGLEDPLTGTWYLTDTAGDVTEFIFGNPGDIPILGDWNGNGTDTPGLFRQSDGFFYGRNSNSTGVADASCFAGDPADMPLAGDWDGDGDDTLGIYRPGNQTFYLFNVTCANAPMGSAQVSFLFGNPGDLPFAADVDGDGVTEVGLFRPTTGFVYYRTTLSTGNADNSFFWGDPADRIFFGDWNANGTQTPGLFRPGNATYYLRNSNTQGNADVSRQLGSPHLLPFAGEVGDVPNDATTIVRDIPALSSELVNLLNASRAAALPGGCGGLPALTVSAALQAVATAHSADMVANNFFDHVSPTTGTPFDRLTAAGISYTTAGENIAIDNSVAEMHAGWMASPGHRENICRTTFGTVGIGVVTHPDGSLYGTQVFTN